jgi:hypothetical protein
MRIGDKLKRYISVTNNGVNLINDEGLKDTLIDLHNYFQIINQRLTI